MKRQKKSETDRLSDLPDHLLLHIIEFMITKYAVQTCVLSKRWKNLWKSLTNIKLLYHFDRYNGDILVNKIVSHILSSRDNFVPLHSISYVNGCRIWHDVFPFKTNILAEIMEYAASHNVQQLEIDTQTDHIRNLELPPSIFNCDSLTSLTLSLRDVYKSNTKMFPKSFNLPALKTLKLVCFTFFTGDNGYAEPFSTCNMLSKLVIYTCNLQDDAQGLCISNSKLSNLAIGTSNSHSNIHKLILSTPKLTSLTIDGIPPIFPAPSTCNLTLFEELKFDCLDGDTMGEDIFISWLHLLAKIKIITLSFKILKLMVNILKNNSSMRAQLPSFVKLKSLKVEAYPWKCDERIREMHAHHLFFFFFIFFFFNVNYDANNGASSSTIAISSPSKPSVQNPKPIIKDIF
ncbi:F-box/LRR-repeat protein At3g26922-like [Trifolium pratense]|uniref:F-box/LRR-repeat protein At3g26922-like n=1 Tax=Trifolium pratense TaxID=57577 RepID=UPI001E690A43|nr:F-box/LRR-repeat protein At3g26922-like [Trifolium pratense]